MIDRMLPRDVLDTIAEAGLILLLFVCPLPFGSVHSGAVFALAVSTAALAWMTLALRPFSALPRAVRPWGVLLPGLLGLALALQALPLPRTITAALSPAAAGLHDGIARLERVASQDAAAGSGAVSHLDPEPSAERRLLAGVSHGAAAGMDGVQRDGITSAPSPARNPRPDVTAPRLSEPPRPASAEARTAVSTSSASLTSLATLGTAATPATADGVGASGQDPARWLTLSVHPEATRAYIARLAVYATLFLVAAGLASRRRAYRRILGAVFAAGIFQAAYGSYEYLSGHQHIFGFTKRFYTDTATGTYINQNHFAGALEMAFLAGLGFFLACCHALPPVPRDATRRQRLAALLDGERGRAFAIAVGTALVGLGLILSYSRTGVVAATAAAAGVVLVDMRRRRERRWMLPVLALAGGVLVLLTLAGWGRVAHDLPRQMQAVSWDQGRVRVWRDCLRIIQDYPLLGTGLGTFADVYPSYRSAAIQLVYDHAHNDYLQGLVETGIVGSALAVMLLGLFWRDVFKGAARYCGSDLALLLGAAGGIAALMLHELTDFNLQIPANAVLFSALAGTLLGALHAQTSDDPALRGRVVPFLTALGRRRSSRSDPAVHHETSLPKRAGTRRAATSRLPRRCARRFDAEADQVAGAEARS